MLCVYVCACVRFSLALTQPPPSRVAVVSNGDAHQELSKVTVRSEFVQRPVVNSGMTRVKRLRPPAVPSTDDKEVGDHTDMYLRVPTHWFSFVSVVYFEVCFFHCIFCNFLNFLYGRQCFVSTLRSSLNKQSTPLSDQVS